MNALKLLAAAAVVCLLVPAARADEKDYPKLIVGSWTVSKADEGTVPKGSVIEFSKDGKVKAVVKKDDAEQTIEGTYKLDGKKMTLTVTIDGTEKTNSVTIDKLTDTELAVEGDDGKKVEFTKKK